MKRILSGIIFASVFFLASCDNKRNDSVENADSINKEKMKDSVLTMDRDDEKFMIKAANGGMMEVQLGKWAHERGMSEQVKMLGHHMMEDHQKSNEQLKELAMKKNVTLPDSVDNDTKDKIKKLMDKKGKDFDKEYASMMVSDHKDDIKMFEEASDNAKDQDLKNWAAATLPTLRMHLDMAQKTDSICKAMDKKRK
jgi:putative membrane protein